MADTDAGARRAIFIVRLDRDQLGRVSGIVERVRTGEKARVDTVADLGPVLAAMRAREEMDRH